MGSILNGFFLVKLNNISVTLRVKVGLIDEELVSSFGVEELGKNLSLGIDGNMRKIQYLTEKTQEMFAMLAWNQRNKVRRQEPSCSLHLLAQTAKDHLQEFKSVQPIPPQPVAVPRARWKPPSEDFVKVNVDGAVFADEDKSGIGLVVL
nr:hypothetical protein CFP56_34160 [Quercus suber]